MTGKVGKARMIELIDSSDEEESIARPDPVGSATAPCPAAQIPANLANGGNSAEDAIFIDSDNDNDHGNLRASVRAKRPRPPNFNKDLSLTIGGMFASAAQRQGRTSSPAPAQKNKSPGSRRRKVVSARASKTSRNPTTGAVAFHLDESDDESDELPLCIDILDESDNEVTIEALLPSKAKPAESGKSSSNIAWKELDLDAAISRKRPALPEPTQFGGFRRTEEWYGADKQLLLSTASSQPVASNETINELLSLPNYRPNTGETSKHVNLNTQPTERATEGGVGGSKVPWIASRKAALPATSSAPSLAQSNLTIDPSPPTKALQSDPGTKKTEALTDPLKTHPGSSSTASPTPSEGRAAGSNNNDEYSSSRAYRASTGPSSFESDGHEKSYLEESCEDAEEITVRIVQRRSDENLTPPVSPSRRLEFKSFDNSRSFPVRAADSNPSNVPRWPPFPHDAPLPSDEFNELLQAPPLTRKITFADSFLSLLGPSRNNEARLHPSTRFNVNLRIAWEDLGRTLREWQIRNGEDCAQSEQDTIEPERLTKDETTSALPECILKLAGEERNFSGGVDPPIPPGRTSVELLAMSIVPSLDEEYINDRTGLPARNFTVVNGADEIMYRFHLHVKESSIPKAGYGVFLRFLGARELKPSKKARLAEIRSMRPPKESTLFRHMTAIHSQGFGMKVTLTGEHLKSRYNSFYPLPELIASVPDDRTHRRKGTKRILRVNLSDPDLPFEDNELEGMRNPDKRIGHYGLFTVDDYVDAAKRTFSSLHLDNGYIDIGRYGPFRTQDRKMELHYQAKAFIFTSEPDMWGFDVPEEILGVEQVIDITDDCTGEPHEVARKNIPMYVNEVGHNKKLNETICAFNENDRVIKYYLKIDKPLKKGEEIELFVNYKKGYERNRERKGYGKRNIDGTIRGDDHFPTCLTRNFADRTDLTLDIKSTQPGAFFMLTVFCYEEIGQKLHANANDFLSSQPCGSHDFSCSVSSRQLVAIRRLEWLTTIFQKHCDYLKKQISTQQIETKVMLEQCDLYIPRMRWRGWTELFSLLDKHPTTIDRQGKNLRNELDREAIEEICFDVLGKLSRPLDDSRWCPIAVKLTETLCKEIARTRWQNHDRKLLAEAFIRETVEAADEIRTTQNTSRLAFGLGFVDPFLSAENSHAARSSKLVVTRNQRAPSIETKATTGRVMAHLMGHAMPIDKVTVKSGTIQTDWYIARQVYLVAATLSEEALADEPSFSQGKLLACLGIDPDIGAAVLAEPTPSIENKWPVLKSKAKPKPKPDARKEKVNSPLFWNIVWPSLKDENGWNLEKGNRDNDFYACPPGVARGKGFKNRVDFFDSVPLVLNFLKSNQNWKDKPGIRRCLQEYYDCKELYEQLRDTRKLPKFAKKEEMTHWLRKRVKANE